MPRNSGDCDILTLLMKMPSATRKGEMVALLAYDEVEVGVTIKSTVVYSPVYTSADCDIDVP